MSTQVYAALGYPQHNGWSMSDPPPDVLEAWVDSLRGVDGLYRHEGRTYTSVEVSGPVSRLGG